MILQRTLLSLIAFTLFLSPLKSAARETLSLNEDWKFLRIRSKKVSETIPPFTNFEEVDIPHDWSWLRGPIKKGGQADKGGYRIGGVSWYQKDFQLPASFADKSVSICFDGVYRRSTVYLNGQKIGGRPYGFISFRHDITPHLKEGTNQLSVQVDCSLEPSTRWYHPCGIYAPVYLEATHATSRITHDGVFITTPQITDEQASVQLSIEVEEAAGLKIQVELLDPKGLQIGSETLDAHPITNTSFLVEGTQLWSPDTPVLYLSLIHI